MSLANCLTKMNAGKPLFDADEIKEIRALVNKNMGKMTEADAERAAVQTLLDEAIAERNAVMELVREGMGLPPVAKAKVTPLNQTGDLFAQKLNPIEIDTKLTGKSAEIQTRFRDWVWNNLDEAIAQYQKANGNVLNTDEARKLSPDYNATPESRSLYSAAVHEPASWLIKEIYRRELEKPTPDGKEKTVVFTAGGTGAGKSTSIKEIAELQRIVSTAQIVFDTNMNGIKSSDLKITQATDKGFEVKILYVYRDPKDALLGALKRAMNKNSESYGRTVPIAKHIDTHVGASETMHALSGKYQGNASVEFIGVDNTRGKGASKQVELDKLPRLAYSQIDIEVYHELVRKEHEEGRINRYILEGTLGKSAYGADDGRGTGGLPQVSGALRPAGASANDAGRFQGVRSGDDGRDQQPASSETVGDQHESRPVGDGSNEGKSSTDAGGSASERKSGSVRPGTFGRNIIGNRLPLNDDRQEAGVRPDAGLSKAGRDTQLGNASGKGDSAGRNAGVPAGRDIPTKSGLNYHLTDSDLDYKGSWLTKARQNVEAVELVKKLESEGRKATREEQSALAKFIGWGASEIRNNIFGAQLDEQLEALAKYDEAITNLGSKSYLTNSNYREYQPAFAVLQAKNPALSWYTAGNITKAMLDAAKPDQAARKWGELRDRLKAVMTDEEWKTAERSTQYAHYTGKEVVNEMWRALDRFGFKGGAVLEPGAGNGVFPGLMPAALANNSAYTGIEFDALTGAILKHLQPDERILVESYIDSALPDNFYDVAIGNPPFSDAKILSDPRYKKHGFALHDYFFAKTMDKVKPGGLVVFVTSRYTMDKQGDKARQYLAERADLLGAIRLPETAFKKNAGTEVVTDILFLRKKVPGETFEGHAWMGLDKIKVKGGEHQINQYFAAHPEMVLGEGAIDKNGMYGANQYTVLPNKNTPIEAQLAAAIDRLPKDVFRPDAGTSSQAAQVREIDWNPKAKKEGNYYVGDNGKLMQVENRVGVQPKLRSKTDEVMIKDFVALRDAVSQAQYDQLNSGDWEKSLKALQKEYHAFVKKHGHILQHTLVERKETVVDEHTGEESEDIVTRRRFTLDSKLNDDPEYTKVRALESINDDTGAITQSEFLTKRTLDMRKEATINTPHDALLSSLNDIGKVDIPLIAERIGLTESEVITSLSTSIYESPSQGWQMSDEYLSGNVKKKLKEVQEAAKTDRKYERNVQALLEAQPSPVPPSDITVSLGMNWIPAEIYEQFLHEKTEVKAKVAYSEHTGTWSVSPISGHGSMAATADWGTPKRNAADILEAGLTGRPIRITETVGSGSDKKTQFDAPGTEAAIQKLKEMRAAFRDWLWQDAERTDKLVSLYNDKFNTTVSRKFDGRHLTLPGSSTTISVFDHVKRGAWRIIQTGNTYLAHSVGAGKTWAMVISAMEQKRLGLINKPMMVVPNHMLQQFAQEWLQLYPAARLMVADEKQFHTDNRRRFIARVSMSDLDGVIITHSAYKLLDLDPEFKQKIINEEIDYLTAALEEVQDDAGEKPGKGKSRNPKVRDIQNRIEKMEEKLKAAMSSEGKDKSVRFDEMGVDMLYVDEAHEFRKLAFTTVRQMKGIDSSGSDRAFDLHMKARWLEQKHPGRSLVMASGTPITNTIAELYSVQRFMQPTELEERGLQDFDAWASMFGEENTEIEADASGKYAPVTRFANFVNVPELTQMFRNFADVLTSDSLAEMLGDKRPKVQNGSRTLEVTPQIDDYLEYKEVLATRLKASKLWKPSRDEPNNPDPVIRIIGDGRLAAIDMRFIDPTLPSDPNSKLNQLIDGVIRVYHETTNNEYNGKDGKVEPIKGGAQMIFSDLGFGAGVTEHRGFNARAWLEKRLRDAGIPVSQVAFMSDHKKSDAKVKLFKDVNAGRVRILIGSSKNMGTGVNAQQRLIALHHLVTPWFPADLEQREGRIIRQGNKNPHVQIYAYSTRGSYDTNMWQLLARKQGFINQALSGDSSVRRMEDISEVSQFQMATAMTAGDERAIRLAGLKAEIDRYDRLFRAHEETRMRMRESYALAGNTITVSERILPDAEKLAARVQDLSGDKFTAKAGGQVFDKRKEWGDALLAKIKDYSDQAKEGRAKVGELSGFDIFFVGAIDRSDSGKVIAYYARLEMPVGEDSVILARDPNDDAVGMSIRATNAIATLARKPEDLRQRIAEAKSKRNAMEGRLDAKFQFTEEYAAKRREAEALEAEMLEDSAKVVAGEEAQQASDGDVAPLASLVSSEKPVVGMSVDRVVRATAKLLASWRGFRHVHVVKSVNDIPDGLYKRALRAHTPIDQGTEGIFDPMTNSVYLIADNIATPDRAIWVAAHEVAGHGGIRMLGTPVSDALDHAAKNGFVAKLAMAIAEDRGETFNARTHTDEAIAELAAATLTGKVDAILERYGVKVPVGMRSNLQGMIKRVVDAVRNFIAKMMGKPVEDVSDGEVLGLIRRMKDAVEGKGQGYDTAGVSNGVLASTRNYGYPLVSGKSSLEGDIADAAKKITGSIARGAESDVEIGRTPHVLGFFMESPMTMVMDATVTRKVFIEKHAHKIVGMTPEMVVQAMYRPALIFKEGNNTFNIITNILTKDGAVMVSVKLDGLWKGKPAAIITSVHPRTNGAISNWINVKDKNRALIYVDELQAPEAVTGRLNPENTNPAFVGRDFVSALGKINTVGEVTSPSPATSPISDNRNVAKQGAPVNFNYRGMATVSTKLQQHLTGKGEPKIKTRKDLQAWIDKHYRGEEENKPLFSSAPVPKPKTAADILRSPNKRGMESDTGLIDKAFRLPFKLIRWDSIVSKNADAVMNKIGDLIPETVKAGIVSNYGLGPEYMDSKADMQAREAAQNRKAFGMVEMLAGLTRAESRVAYYWMQEQPGSAVEQRLLEQMPEASRETLAKLKKLISDLGKEAVRLGQMSQDAYERNNMAYLHRTYAKHVLAPDGWLGRYLQTRALKIKGNQYKGRGIFDEVPMSMIGGDTITRKLQKGQADKQLVGERVIRFERRDASTEAMDPLPGMTGKQIGKLRELIYWPASEPVPAKYGDWVNAGTFEVRDTKGDKLVVWRDLTREERERLGELDEVRYAVAQTLQMMVHDIEVGRFLEWTANKYGKVKPEGKEVSASESMLTAYGPDTWVQVPKTNITGTQTKKYGTLAGLYVPGSIWNDIRQTAGTRIEPFGKTYASVLRFWKKSKTVWSPTVHMNNVMANFVMADWNDIRAVDLADALRVWAMNGKPGYKEMFQRFEDSGALGGMFQSNEVMRDEIKQRLAELKADLTSEQDAAKEMGTMAKVLQLVSLVSVKPVKGAAELAAKAYQNEDAFFRLAVFLKAVRYGKTDIEAGRMARHAFLNYDINAPWIQMARQTILPFISFFYRAAPMLFNTAKNKPWKIAKLVAFAYMVNALGYAMAGGGDDEDKDRKLMPPEKGGSVWGLVPKMIRMPWNHDDGSAVFLDVRRWVPVGDIADMEMGAGMMPPWATPSGPAMAIVEAALLNKSMFTEKDIVSDTDSLSGKTEKRLDYLFKSMMPNVPLPNPINLQLGGTSVNPFNLDQGSFQSYSWSGIEKAVNRQENTIGEVKTTPAAIASAFGIKLAAYPHANMEAAIKFDFKRKSDDLVEDINKIARDYSRLEKPTANQTAAKDRDTEIQKAKIEMARNEMNFKLSQLTKAEYNRAVETLNNDTKKILKQISDEARY